MNLEVSHFPGTLSCTRCIHPLFYEKQSTLLSHSRKWDAAELTRTDSYLLFLALMNSTGLVHFHSPAHYAPNTDSFVASSMESLTRCIGYINSIRHPAFEAPQIVISRETADLAHAYAWINLWHDAVDEFLHGAAARRESQLMIRREATLQAFIKEAQRPISDYARILADWASVAASFPSYLTPIDSAILPLDVYWRSIIVKCCKAEHIFTIPEADLVELIDHCEKNLEHGSIYSYTLLDLLRAGHKRMQNYLGLGSADLDVTTYTMVDADTPTEIANKLAMIQSAPSHAPQLAEYPTKLAYLRAKAAYQMAQEYAASQPNVVVTPEGEI